MSRISQNAADLIGAGVPTQQAIRMLPEDVNAILQRAQSQAHRTLSTNQPPVTATDMTGMANAARLRGYFPRPQPGLPFGAQYTPRIGGQGGMYANFMAQHPGGGYLGGGGGQPWYNGKTGQWQTGPYQLQRGGGMSNGLLAPTAQQQGGFQLPSTATNFPQQLGLGDFYTPHGPGDAQNVANSTVGANFIGNQWGQVPGQNGAQQQPYQYGGSGSMPPPPGYAPRMGRIY